MTLNLFIQLFVAALLGLFVGFVGGAMGVERALLMNGYLIMRPGRGRMVVIPLDERGRIWFNLTKPTIDETEPEK